MRFNVDIQYPLEKMQQNARRMQTRQRFEYADRVPVLFCLEPRYFTPIFGINYQDFFRDAETQYQLQLEFYKFRVENIPEDCCQSTDLVVYPYFDNVVPSSAFGAEVHYPDNETLHVTPVIHTVEQMDRVTVPEQEAGLLGKVLDWHRQMEVFATETEVTFNGSVPGRVIVAPLSAGALSPHMVAVDLAGHNFYLWMLECPEKCHRMLETITQGLLQAESHFRSIDPRPRGAYGLAEDSIQVCPPEAYEEFCVPYNDRLYEAFGTGLPDGRGIHMCGESTHLLESLVEKGHLTSFNLFGYRTPLKEVARTMGGKVLLWGNINPMLLQNGTRDEVRAAAAEALETLATCGGYMLGDGANVCPGTPLENLAALVETAEEYGAPVVSARL